jgi:hypothetical protein
MKACASKRRTFVPWCRKRSRRTRHEL